MHVCAMCNKEKSLIAICSVREFFFLFIFFFFFFFTRGQESALPGLPLVILYTSTHHSRWLDTIDLYFLRSFERFCIPIGTKEYELKNDYNTDIIIMLYKLLIIVLRENVRSNIKNQDVVRSDKFCNPWKSVWKIFEAYDKNMLISCGKFFSACLKHLTNSCR